MRNTQNNQAKESTIQENEPKVLEFSKIEILCYKLMDQRDVKSYKKALWNMCDASISNADDYFTPEDRSQIMGAYRDTSKFIRKINKEVQKLKDSGMYIPIHS